MRSGEYYDIEVTVPGHGEFLVHGVIEYPVTGVDEDGEPVYGEVVSFRAYPTVLVGRAIPDE